MKGQCLHPEFVKYFVRMLSSQLDVTVQRCSAPLLLGCPPLLPLVCVTAAPARVAVAFLLNAWILRLPQIVATAQRGPNLPWDSNTNGGTRCPQTWKRPSSVGSTLSTRA